MGNICVMEGVMQKARTSFLACFLLTVSLWSAKAETTVIEVLNYFNVEDQVKALKDAVASFERANPDIKVQLTYVPFGELLSRTLQTAAVHWPPAISVLDNPDVLRAAEAGILKDLSGRMAEFPFWDNIYSGVRLAVTSGNHVYGIPIGSNGFALFYNKKLFRDVGIQEPPRDWDELRKVAKALTKDPVYGFAFPATNTEECTSAFEPFLWSNRGSLLDIDGSRAKEALRLWMDMLNDGSVSHDVVTWNIGDVSNQFLGGKAAMMLMGPWMLPAMKRSGLDYGVAPVPVPKIGLKPVVAIGGEVWCVMKNDQKIEDAAVKFVSFMEEPERLFKLCLASNYISSVRDLAQKEGEINPDLKPYIEEMETAKPRVSEGGDSYPQISQILRTALQKVLTGQSSIDSALADAAAQIKALDIKQ
jgi:multiple sugar transport system substrate-binding protein